MRPNIYACHFWKNRSKLTLFIAQSSDILYDLHRALYIKKGENAHKFAISAIREERDRESNK